MPKLFIVSIDWKKLKQHLAVEQGTEPADEDMRTWLIDAGFKALGDRWIVREKDLGHLDPSEVTKVEETESGD